MTKFFKTLFVFSSFGPLYFIVWVKLWVTTGICSTASLIFVSVSLCSAIVSVFLMSRLKTDQGHPFRLTNIQPADSEIFPYLMTYIPIFVEINITDPAFAIPVAVLYLLIFTLYLRLDSPYLHPFFALAGFRIYTARTQKGNPLVVVSKGRKLVEGEEINLHEIGNGDLYYCE